MLYRSKDGVIIRNLQCLRQYFEAEKLIDAIFTMNQNKTNVLCRLLLEAGYDDEALYIQFCIDQIAKLQKGEYVEPIAESLNNTHASPKFFDFLAESERNDLLQIVKYILSECDRKNLLFLEKNYEWIEKICSIAREHTAAEYGIYFFTILFLCMNYERSIPKSDRDKIELFIKDYAGMLQIKPTDNYFLLDITEDTKLPWHKEQGMNLSVVCCRNITDVSCKLTIVDGTCTYDYLTLLPGESVWALRSGAGFAYFLDAEHFDCACDLGNMGIIRINKTGTCTFESTSIWNKETPDGLDLSRPVVAISRLGSICCFLHYDGTVSTNYPGLDRCKIKNALRVCVLKATIAVIHQDHSACFYPNSQNQVTAPEGKFLAIVADSDTYVGITLDGKVISNKLSFKREDGAVMVNFAHGQFEVKYRDGTVALPSSK